MKITNVIEMLVMMKTMIIIMLIIFSDSYD